MNPGPMLRIYIGFMLVTAAMAYASILQYQIYLKSPCQKYASGCSLGPAPISVWAQLPAYLLIAMSQILVTITGMEYGYNQSQKGMKSIVMCLFTITIAGGDLLNVIISFVNHLHTVLKLIYTSEQTVRT
jgi:POT family proton-dependent oligopeptide transporter